MPLLQWGLHHCATQHGLRRVLARVDVLIDLVDSLFGHFVVLVVGRRELLAIAFVGDVLDVEPHLQPFGDHLADGMGLVGGSADAPRVFSGHVDDEEEANKEGFGWPHVGGAFARPSIKGSRVHANVQENREAVSVSVLAVSVRVDVLLATVMSLLSRSFLRRESPGLV